jgi:hypothetical protein
MKMSLAFAAMLLFATAGLPSVSHAQQGCKTSTYSCSQLYNDCEKKCRARGTGDICIAKFCSTGLSDCKATGVWKSASSGSACWTTTKRS